MLRNRLLAADTIEIVEALRWVEYWLRWFDERADQDVDGTLSLLGASEHIETLYLDGPRSEDWRALTKRGDVYLPVLGSSHVFEPTV